ncbi:disulfide bond formation protein DsbA [Novosphingobium fuchskuhlense]|uniref:2-hydroxychromene-2-carboxylate isomerase n=1 Tax=Novosphingobium fuchskuhlense TaxID=1117702 RepID=A0A124JVS5_9SPHN|nr:2-hydroxychromene-2-carboxylate isomerase [Novosphingobium fuchskuhlense]KUR72590.1 disulfide bond formation protein DsbA [Novosphingobium fuchskuhlense]
MKTIEFIFDFVSPNGYLVWRPLQEIAARKGATITLVPTLLGGMHKLTGNAPPFLRDAEIKGKNAYAQLEMQRFITRHGLTRFRMNPAFPFRSVELLRMLLAAIDLGCGEAFAEAFLRAIWEEGLDPADSAAVDAVIAAAGLPAAALAEGAQSAPVKDRLAANTQAAVERGAFGIPTFFVEGEMFFGKERLGQIEELL